MSTPRPGVLPKQGPLATLENFSYGAGDRFMFNSNQYVLLTAKKPTPLLASPRISSIVRGEEVEYYGYDNFKDNDDNFRLVNGNPTNYGVYSGAPSVPYDHVVVGYDTPVTANEIKFWCTEYVPVDYINIDYSYDGVYFYNITLVTDDVSFVFDDTIKVYSDEASPTGMYIYTVDLGADYTAKYWRIRSFIYTKVLSKVTDDVAGKSLSVSSTSRWPSSADVWVYKPFNTSAQSYHEVSSYGAVSRTYVDGVVSTVSSLYISGVATGVVDAGSVLSVYENGFGNIGYAVLESFTIDSTPDSVTVVGNGYIPNYSTIGPHGGEIFVYLDYTLVPLSSTELTYSSKTSNTFVNITSAGYTTASEDILAGSYIKYQYYMDVSQVLIGRTNKSLLKFWETDGNECSVKEVQVSNVYDAVYDIADGVYYAVGFNSTGGVGIDASDDFSDGDSATEFDSDRWEYSGNGFSRNDTLSKLYYKNTSSTETVFGRLKNKMYYTTGVSYTVSGTVSFTKLENKGFIGIVSFDEDTDNYECGIFAVGPWDNKPNASFVSVVVSGGVSDYANGNASITNLSVMPYELPEDYHKHTFMYDGDSWLYTRQAESISSVVEDVIESDVGVGPNVSVDGLSFELSYNNRVTEGSFLSFLTSKVTASGVTDDAVVFHVEGVTGSSTNVYAVDNYVEVAKQSISSGFASSVQQAIYGCTSHPVDLLFGPFVASSGYNSDVPTFFVKSFNNDGELEYVSGVSNIAGTVIASLDVIRDSTKTYGDYVNKVFIASDQYTEAGGGSLYIAVLPDIYKFNKTTLPLLSNDDGSGAVVLLSGSITDTSISNFSFDGYYNSGLSYETYDDDRENVFLKCISSSLLSPTIYEAALDLTSISDPLAVDPSDLHTLYTVVNDAVYVYNINDTSVAFCDVTSIEPVIPAGSDYTTEIKAFVTNLYGDPLANKTVYFSVSSGDGSVSPTYACTTASGTAATTYTAGEYTGVSIITATASNDAC